MNYDGENNKIENQFGESIKFILIVYYFREELDKSCLDN